METLSIVAQSWPLAMVVIIFTVTGAVHSTIRRTLQRDEEVQRLKDQILFEQQKRHAIEHRGHDAP